VTAPVSSVALFALALRPVPLDLDALSVERARSLSGKPVVATFLVPKPSYTWRSVTIVGAADRPDGAERGAHLAGRRFDIEEGKRVTVTGLLWVIDHAPAFANGQPVPAWVEVRIEEGK
jgi:hypothetical protein